MPGDVRRLKVRSMVGLIPLFAVETLEPELVDRLPGFKRRMQWFIDNRPEFRGHVATRVGAGGGVRRLLSIVRRPQLLRVLGYMLDRDEFLSSHGIRALSRYHPEHPYVLQSEGAEHRVDYEPAESRTGLFGGNSNWRGPVWFPVNYLLIESLQKFHHFYGDDLKVECPIGSSRLLNLWEVAAELSRGLTRPFLRGRDGRRPIYGGSARFQNDPHWRDLILFYEYFHGDDGSGIGANHPAGYDPRYHFQLAIEAGCSAYAAPLGFLEAGAREFAGQIPLILKLNNHDVLYEEKDPEQAVTGSVRDALRLGCVAIGYTIYPGSTARLDMHTKPREMAEEAKANGLVVVIWSYPRGSGLSRDGETALDVTAYAAHIAAQLGAHVIKVKLPSAHLEQAAAKKVYETTQVPSSTLAERVRHVVQASFNGRRIVIFSGGAAARDDQVFDEVRAIRDGGGFGSIIGRNSFQRSKPEALKFLATVMGIYAGTQK